MGIIIFGDLHFMFLRCLKCFSATDVLVDKKRAMDLNGQTLNRLAVLRRPDVDGTSIEVEEIW